MNRKVRENRMELVAEGKDLMNEVLEAYEYDTVELISEAFADAAWSINMWLEQWGMADDEELTEKEREEYRSYNFTEDKLGYLWSINKISCIDNDENLNYDEKPTVYKPTMDDLYEAVAIMKNEYGWHWDNLAECNGDEETFDVLIQCAVFGDIIFG